MSVHVIFYQNGAKHLRPVQSEEELRQLRGTERQQSLVARARQGHIEAKRRLLQFNYSCLPNEDGSLKSSTRLSGSVGMDIDFNEADYQDEKLSHAVRNRILAMRDAIGLLFFERSATKGYHIAFKRHPELSQEENLRWASQLLGVRFDEGAKDHTRVFFSSTASADDLLFVSPALFDNTTAYAAPASSEPALQTAQAASEPTLQVDPASQPLPDAQAPQNALAPQASEPILQTAQVSQPLPDSAASESFPQDYDDIPYSLLVDCLADQLGGVPVHGSRNNFLFSMACHLRYVCDDDPLWIRQVLPTYGEDPKRLYRTIQSACNRAQSRNMPSMVLRAISVARKQLNLLNLSAASGTSNPLAAPAPPEMPKKLPRLIQLLVSKVDPMYRPAVAQAVFPPLGAHLHGVITRYIDNSVNDLGGFMSILMAKQSIGKGSVNMPIELIMEDIRQRDDYSRNLERQWKEQCKQAKSTEKKPSRPEGLCVQYLMSNMTNAAMVQRLLDVQAAGGKFIYVKLDEIELLDQIKATGGATASEIIRLAFTQSLYGQERIGHESVTGTPPLRFNFNASTTIPSGQAYFRNGLTNGTLSRLTFATIIRPLHRRGIPRFGDYDEQFRQQLQPFINNLNAATGLIECRQAEKMAERIMEENADLAELSDDDVFETLSFRANRIAYDKAMLLFIAQGYQWTKEIADFCQWSEQYDLWCKLHFFGQQMREENLREQLPSVCGPQNMLELLPDRFGKQELMAIHRAQGRDGNVMQLIYTWTNRGYIEQDQATMDYIKTPKYLAKHKRVVS